MKRYLTLLTLSFLSTSTLVKAGQFDIHNLPEDRDQKFTSLRAKADKLERNIDNTENADLRDAFSKQHGVISNCLDGLVRGYFNPPNYEAYLEAKEQGTKIKASFAEEVITGTHDAQLNKIHGIIHSAIYVDESQEFQDLQMALQVANQITADSSPISPVKAAGRFLKMEKSITQHIQKADMIQDDAKKIKASGVRNDLETLERKLSWNSDEAGIVRQALNYLREIDGEIGFSGYLSESILAYKALEKELEPLLIPYRQSKQDAPAVIASVFSGTSDYVELEEGLSSRYSYYGGPEEVQNFLSMMREIKGLPYLLMKLKELQPRVQQLLENPPASSDGHGSSSSNHSGLPSTSDAGWSDLDLLLTQPGLLDGFEITPKEGIGNNTPSTSGSSMPSVNPAAAASAPADEPALQEVTFRFHMGEQNDYHTFGFSAFEGPLRWTDGEEAIIMLPLAEMGHPFRVSFLNTQGYVTASHPQQRLTIKVNEVEAGNYNYTLADNNKRIDINLPVDADVEEAIIEFKIPDAISPSNLGTGGDQRKLGIAFRDVELYKSR